MNFMHYRAVRMAHVSLSIVLFVAVAAGHGFAEPNKIEEFVTMDKGFHRNLEALAAASSGSDSRRIPGRLKYCPPRIRAMG